MVLTGPSLGPLAAMETMVANKTDRFDLLVPKIGV